MNCLKLFCCVLLLVGGTIAPSCAQMVSDKVDVLVIDPGHGGKDPGCVGKKAREKDVVLAVALKFGKMVKEKFPDVKVYYTRSDDRFIELWKRGQIANDHHADLFVSIHCNASPSASASGVETWLRGSQKNEANLAEVQRENAVVYQEQNHEKNYSQSWMDVVTATLHQDAGFENSIYFAQELQNEYKRGVSASPNRGIKQGPFYVLWKSARPSILTEIGFLSNPAEEKFLLSEEGRQKVAECLLNAFAKYKRRIDMRSSGTLSSPQEPVAPVQEKTEPVKDEPATLIVEKSEPAVDTVKKQEEKTDIRIESGEIEFKPQNPVQDTERVGKIEFRVQLAASGKDLDLKPYNFGGLSDLSKHYDEQKSLYRYYYSRSSSMEGLDGALREAKEAGYPSAFVTAFENGRPIGLQEALEKIKKQAEHGQ